MLRGPKVFPTGYALFIALSEPQARRRTAKVHSIPSGAVIVLVTVSAVHELGEIIHPSQLYAARLMSPSLLRRYLAVLVKAGLVQRYTTRGRARLRLTVEGMVVCNEYKRHLLGGAREYLREQAITE
jgi:DNA-binding MarR family transcriptional regulator